jgi:hypothetical protein
MVDLPIPSSPINQDMSGRSACYGKEISECAEGTGNEHKMGIFRAREATVDSCAPSAFAHFYRLDGQFRLFVRGFLP